MAGTEEAEDLDIDLEEFSNLFAKEPSPTPSPAALASAGEPCTDEGAGSQILMTPSKRAREPLADTPTKGPLDESIEALEHRMRPFAEDAERMAKRIKVKFDKGYWRAEEISKLRHVVHCLGNDPVTSTLVDEVNGRWVFCSRCTKRKVTQPFKAQQFIDHVKAPSLGNVHSESQAKLSQVTLLNCLGMPGAGTAAGTASSSASAPGALAAADAGVADVQDVQDAQFDNLPLEKCNGIPLSQYTKWLVPTEEMGLLQLFKAQFDTEGQIRRVVIQAAVWCLATLWTKRSSVVVAQVRPRAR